MVHPQSNLQLSAELKLELIVQHFQTLIWYWPTISLRPGPVELQNTAMERTCGWTWFRHVSAIEMISTSLPWIGRRWPGRDRVVPTRISQNFTIERANVPVSLSEGHGCHWLGWWCGGTGRLAWLFLWGKGWNIMQSFGLFRNGVRYTSLYFNGSRSSIVSSELASVWRWNLRTPGDMQIYLENMRTWCILCVDVSVYVEIYEVSVMSLCTYIFLHCVYVWV